MEMRHGVFARTNFWRAPNLSSPTKPHFHNLNPKMEKLLIEGAIKETGYAANSISIFLLPSIFPSMRQPEIFGFFGLFFFDLQMTTFWTWIASVGIWSCFAGFLHATILYRIHHHAESVKNKRIDRHAWRDAPCP
mmetsp:Transcript_26332/g.64177  ORF Transcript_26332/g.64177 Transcript_26332/m.64177 type:complete len:135 (-) Transcript_26332:531-935(-)